MLWQKKYIFVLLYFACAKIAKKNDKCNSIYF